MIGIQLELDKTDLAKIDRILKEMGEKVGKREVMKAIRKGAKPVVSEAKKKAPVSGKKTFMTAHRHISKGVQSTRLQLHKPGELKRSIGIISGRGGWSIYIGPRFGRATAANDAWYAHFVEFGTASTGWGRGIKAQPYMRPAWDMTHRKVIDLIGSELSQVVDRITK